MSHQVIIPARAPALIYDTETHCLRIATLPVPDANRSEEHLVFVKAVALTAGELRWPEPASCSPAIPGYEVSGSVLSAPAGSPFPVGSEVYARTSFERQGNARRYTVALTRELGHKPTNISWSQAATVPLSALTAWQALFVHGGFAPPRGDTAKNAARRVLVTAASGGVGIWVIQLARLAGVGEIIGTCGPANLELVKTLGAHEAVNYMKHKDLSVWVDNRGCGKFDVVIDAVGGAGLEQAWICVKERGLLISIVTPPHAKKPYHGVEKDVNGLFFIVEADASQLKEITGLLERGECRAVVDTEYRLEDYINAFERLQGGHLTGKVVLNL